MPVSTLPQGSDVPVTLTAADPVGHTSTRTWHFKIDRSPPSGAVIDPGPVAGTKAIAGTATDSAAGMGTWVLQFQRPGESTWTNACQTSTPDPDGHWSCPWNTNDTTVPDGAYKLRAVMTDKTAGGGNSATTPEVPVVVDNTPPSLTASGDLYDRHDNTVVHGTWDLSGEATDVGAGVTRIAVYVDDSPLTLDGGQTAEGGMEVGAVSAACPQGACRLALDDAPFDTSEYADGNHAIRLRATDGAGNVTDSTFRISITPPDANCSSPSFDTYNAGPEADGKPMSDAERTCQTADPEADADRQDQVTYVYGTCEPQGDDEDSGGCQPPIEVQSSPLCERHWQLYSDGPAPPDHQELTVLGVPAVSYDDGSILEIYTGNTTITIYGESAELVSSLAQQLRPALPADIPEGDQILTEVTGTTQSVGSLPPPDASILAATVPCP